MLAWARSLDSSITGYHLYYGTISRDYTNMISVGPSATATISGLTEGATYYFAVTAVNDLGLESDYSNEVRHTVPSTRPRLQLLISPGNRVVLRITGQIGHLYEIQASQNLTNWSAIGIAPLNLGDTFDFIDTNASGQSARFYRLWKIL